jgi:hypothetical protein
MSFEIFGSLFDCQSINAGATLVGFDVFPRLNHILTQENLL